MSGKHFALIVLISIAITALIWSALPKPPADDARHGPQGDPSSAPVPTAAAEDSGAAVVAQGPRWASPGMSPESFRIETPRLRLIPPVNAAQWLAVVHPPASGDKIYKPRLHLKTWQSGKLIVHEVVWPEAVAPAPAAEPQQWGIDLHRPELLEPSEEPSLRMIVARRWQQYVSRTTFTVTPAPDAGIDIVYSSFQVPDAPVIATQIPLLVAMQGTRAGANEEALSPEAVRALADQATWLLVVYLEIEESGQAAAPATPVAAEEAVPDAPAAIADISVPDVPPAEEPLPPANDVPPPAAAPQAAAESTQLSDTLPENAWYVSPTGRADGIGSMRRPLSLARALNTNGPVRPGDSILLLGGRYEGGFVGTVSGSKDLPITIRPAGDDPVKIVSIVSEYSPMHLRGDWLILQDIELTVGRPRNLPATVLNSMSLMTHLATHPTYERMRGAGVVVGGSNVVLQGLRIHDCGEGIWLLNGATPVEVHGCIIYNNGFLTAGGPRGAGIRLSNRGNRKLISNNVIFNQFGPGIEAFSAPADVSRIEISGNVVFNSGLAGVLSQPNVVVGTHQSEATGIIVQDNIFWQRSGMAAAFGSKSAEGEITVSGNYFRGLVRFRQWRKASVMRNTFAATGTLIVLHLPGVKPDGYAWNRNSYFWQESDFEPFAHYADNAGGGLNWFQWKHTTSFDSAGTFVKGGLKKPYVQTRSMSRDGAGRWYYAAVVASDGSEAAVEVDLSAVLPDGARFRVYHVEDVERLRPVLEETWSGKAVALPMRAVPGPESLAGLLLSLPASGPEFQVFIIERLSGDAEVEPALSASN